MIDRQNFRVCFLCGIINIRRLAVTVEHGKLGFRKLYADGGRHIAEETDTVIPESEQRVFLHTDIFI